MTCSGGRFLIPMAGLVLGTGCWAPSSSTAERSIDLATGPVPRVTRGSADTYLAEPVEVTKPWRIVFVAKDDVPEEGDERFWGRAWRAMKRDASLRGVTMQVIPTACQTCIDDQIVKLNMLAEVGDIDGLIVGAVDTVHLAPVIEKVIARGIPTIAFDTPVDAEGILTLVTNDNQATGRAVAEWVVGQLGGQGTVAVLNGPWGQQNALERRAGIFEGLASGAISVVASEPARWKRSLAEREVTTWLTELPRLDAIVAANDAMALGALDALAGQTPRPLVTGVDGDPEAVRAVQDGRMDLTVVRDSAREGQAAVEVMLRHLERGETFPPMVVVSDVHLLRHGEVAP